MLTGYIRGQELRISTPEIAADSIKYLEAEFHFAGRGWDGYVKTVYFINGASKFALVLADDRITAGMGLNLTAGEWEVKLSGVKGDSRITTTTERIYVREFGGTEGTLPDVTPTQAEQLLAKIGDMSALETDAKNSLVAAINEAAKSGGGGSGGGKDGTGIESITYKGEDESGGNMYTVLLTDGTSYDITAPKGAAGADGTPGIVISSEEPTDPNHPVWIDPEGDETPDNPLDITGATVGQIAKIAAVDASGIPTAWSPVDMPSGGGGETWELIAEIDFNVDAANDVSVWEYKNLPSYKELAYKKVSLVGSTEQQSGLSVAINGSPSQPSAIGYAKNGGQSNGWGKIFLLPFGWMHVNSGDSNSPTNHSMGGLVTMYNAIQFSGDSITSVRLSSHSTYKIAGGKLSLYGRR